MQETSASNQNVPANLHLDDCASATAGFGGGFGVQARVVLPTSSCVAVQLAMLASQEFACQPLIGRTAGTAV
jgi:hypothetical protein